MPLLDCLINLHRLAVGLPIIVYRDAMPTAVERSSVSADRVVGALLLGLGINTILGWCLRVPAMVEIIRGLVPMVFNTGLCFALTGLALWLNNRERRLPRTLIGWVLLVPCTLTLAEHVTDVSLGIDIA
ncbi:hypothetical protein [Massilia sp. METH4]|uniref:hypothetical protein n=1 Tax=Massilia sp. METH4 TaxID=3123041 RepID=UPI0030D3E4BF